MRLAADLLDFTDAATGDSSMARTTGYPALLAALMLVEGRLPDFKGVVPAERLADSPAALEFVYRELKERGVALELREQQTDR